MLVRIFSVSQGLFLAELCIECVGKIQFFFALFLFDLTQEIGNVAVILGRMFKGFHRQLKAGVS